MLCPRSRRPATVCVLPCADKGMPYRGLPLRPLTTSRDMLPSFDCRPTVRHRQNCLTEPVHRYLPVRQVRRDPLSRESYIDLSKGDIEVIGMQIAASAASKMAPPADTCRTHGSKSTVSLLQEGISMTNRKSRKQCGMNGGGFCCLLALAKRPRHLFAW